jgi:arsenical pump membrane protein
MWVWVVVALSIACVILRPFGMKEVYPAVAGAALLVLCGLLPVVAAARGVAQGGDVYLFLAGMMFLSELASDQGLFAWAAGLVAAKAHGSATRLFCLIYALAVVVTVFLSNDATAVVMTPAVAAMAAAAKAEAPLPFLLICAFVANAASFVLPISNPANLVIFAKTLPPLDLWLGRFWLASVVSIAITFAALWWTQRRALRQTIAVPQERPELGRGARLTGYGIGGTAVLLLAASSAGIPLGLPTFCGGVATAALVLIPARQTPWPLLGRISWSTLVLVAGLFVMVAALDRNGAATGLAHMLSTWSAQPGRAALGVGIGLGFATNLVNNLPAGLLAGHALTAAHLPAAVTNAALIGVDLGPNLSVTGSLATILWLQALRRAGIEVTAWQFLRLGAVVMPPALVLAVVS